jgi:hypothetical protein
MDEACTTHGRGEKYIQNFSPKPRRQKTKDHLEDLGIDGRIFEGY